MIFRIPESLNSKVGRLCIDFCRVVSGARGEADLVLFLSVLVLLRLLLLLLLLLLEIVMLQMKMLAMMQRNSMR